MARRVDVLAQVHIPKCAGTSVCNWLERSARAGLTSGYGNLYAPDLLDADKLWEVALYDARITTISGHNIRKFPEMVHARVMHYFTILRNPRAQMRSMLRYMIQERVAFGIPVYVGNTVYELIPWLITAKKLALVENAQTNHLALYTWCSSAPMRCNPATYLDWNADDMLAYKQDRLAIARETLASFLAVGTVERLAESMDLMRHRSAAFGINLLPASAISTINVTNPDIDPCESWPSQQADEGIWHDALADDEALYTFGNGLLDQSISVFRGPHPRNAQISISDSS